MPSSDSWLNTTYDHQHRTFLTEIFENLAQNNEQMFSKKALVLQNDDLLQTYISPLNKKDQSHKFPIYPQSTRNTQSKSMFKRSPSEIKQIYRQQLSPNHIPSMESPLFYEYLKSDKFQQYFQKLREKKVKVNKDILKLQIQQQFDNQKDVDIHNDYIYPKAIDYQEQKDCMKLLKIDSKSKDLYQTSRMFVKNTNIIQAKQENVRVYNQQNLLQNENIYTQPRNIKTNSLTTRSHIYLNQKDNNQWTYIQNQQNVTDRDSQLKLLNIQTPKSQARNRGKSIFTSPIINKK